MSHPRLILAATFSGILAQGTPFSEANGLISISNSRLNFNIHSYPPVPGLAASPLSTAQGTGKRSLVHFASYDIIGSDCTSEFPTVLERHPNLLNKWLETAEKCYLTTKIKIAISSHTAGTTAILFSYIRESNSFFTPTNVLSQLIISGFLSWLWSGLSFPLAYINQFYDLKENIYIVLDLGKLFGSPFASESTAN